MMLQGANTTPTTPAQAICESVAQRGTTDYTAMGEEPSVLADIYDADISLAVWRRRLSEELQAEAQALCRRAKPTQLSLAVTPDKARSSVAEALALAKTSRLCADIAELVDMFGELFGCTRVGLRFTTLERPMCPRFHVDQLGCRLITTYAGAATEWLPHSRVRRARLGTASAGIVDHQAGICRCESDIERLRRGDVALLKGEGWEGNEGRGLVHRSPAMDEGDKRVLLTLDIL